VGVRIEKVDLPGIGVRHDIITSNGRRISVVSHRNGDRELALFDAIDPDACTDSIPVSDQEAAALADVLGGSVMLGQLTGLSQDAPGLFTEHMMIPPSSPYVNRPLGDTKARTRTHVSIVAIVRDSDVVPSPTPDFVLQAGDSIVAVGTRSGLDKLANIIADSSG
jgi:TrkA domain protein